MCCMWGLQAKLTRSFLSNCSRSTQTPAFSPILLAVVSKDISFTLCKIPFLKKIDTAVACCSPEPFGICRTPKSFIIPSDTRTANWSMYSLDDCTGSIFPSQFTVSGTWGSKDFYFLSESLCEAAEPFLWSLC